MENKSIIHFNLEDHLNVLSKNTLNYSTLYRIESNASGLGPFSFDRNFDIGKYSNQLSPNRDPGFYNGYRPYLREDDIFGDNFQWFLFFQERARDAGEQINFACFSLDNLKEWFPIDELKRFHEAGLSLSIIQVCRSWSSNTQAIFLKSDIISSESKSILEIL